MHPHPSHYHSVVLSHSHMMHIYNWRFCHLWGGRGGGTCVCWVSRVEAMRTARRRHYWSRWRWRCWTWGLHVVQWKKDLEISLSMYVQLGWNGSWIAEKCIPILIIVAVWCGPETVQLPVVISAFTRVPCGLCVSVCQMCASVSLWLSPFSWKLLARAPSLFSLSC